MRDVEIRELRFESPIGELRLAASAEALVGVYLDDHSGWAAATSQGRGHPVLEEARSQLRDWFAGRRTVFELPLEPRGTPFQLTVWRALTEIPYGKTISYHQLAAAVGRPTAARAVGAANARNPLAIVVPCHRVIGASGALTGYAGGLPRKRWLLEHERTVAGAVARAEARGGPPSVARQRIQA